MTITASLTRKQRRVLALIEQRGLVTSLVELASTANLPTGVTALIEVQKLVTLDCVEQHPDGGYAVTPAGRALLGETPEPKRYLDPPEWCNSTVPYEALVIFCRACDVHGLRRGARCTHRGLDLGYAEQAWQRLAQIATQAPGGAS